MTIQNDFSAVVAKMIADAQKVVNETWNFIDLEGLLKFFGELTAETPVSMLEFSDAVRDLVSNPLCGEDERGILQLAIAARRGVLHPTALETYLNVTGDEAVGKMYLEAFFAHKPDFDTEIPHDDPRVWDLKRAFSTVRVMAPEQAPAFAATALEMFRKLPKGQNNTGGLYALMFTFAEKREVTHMITKGAKLVTASGNGKLHEVNREDDNKGEGRKLPVRKVVPASKAGPKQSGQQQYVAPAPTADSIAQGQAGFEKDRKAQRKIASAPSPAFAVLVDYKNGLPSLDGTVSL